ncbi:hypothetical protein [Symbioplanes lichenis]|uniref:hypothetical protein n=1 Tax=Symbioplanes lichenis TaxID=1629072 RepID=UPI002738CCC3|nr:hypothetical protein [Actinoplanes lichenis]
MLDALRDRPPGEPVWTSLRRLFDILDSPQPQAALRPVHRMVFDSPSLLATYLQRLQLFQHDVVAVLRARADHPALPAWTAAAFGCLIAAQQAWLADADGEEPLTTHLDRAMGTLHPVE